MNSVLQFLGQNPIVPLFIILGLGLIVGKIRLGGVQLGSVTGVLFVGLVFGHYGYKMPAGSLNLGFILFIFCVGVQAGPQFIAAFKKDGARYALLAVITASTAVAVTVVITRFFDFPFGMNAGALAGALTSTPTLVAAQDAVAAGLKHAGGLSAEQVLSNLSSSYAITYVFGLAGLVVFMAFMPKMFGVDVALEAREYESEGGVAGGGVEKALRMSEMPTIRAYRIENSDVVGREWDDDDWRVAADTQKVKRGNDVFTPEFDYKPELDDIVAVVATSDAHKYIRNLLGPEVVDYDVLDRTTTSRTIMVSSNAVAGKSLSEMHFVSKYQCYLTEVIRSGVNMPRRPDLQLQLGDVLVVTGSRNQLDELAEEVGYSEGLMEQTDLVSFAFGIAVGVVIGLFTITVGGIKIGLGTAGGTMLAGVVFGIIHSRKPTIARFPGAARSIIMELGMLLFMTNVAVSAGTGIIETLKSSGVTLAFCGILITLIPVLACFAVGRYAFKMNGAILLGAVTGSMTNTASLTQVTKLARSSVPTIGYAGTYAFGNILLAVAGTILMLL